MEKASQRLEFIILGGSRSGKTSIRRAFCEKDYVLNQEQPATIGVDFSKCLHVENQRQKQLYLWQLTGGYRFMEIGYQQYLPKVHFVFFVFDVSNRHNYNYLFEVIQKVYSRRENFKNTVYACVIGSKAEKQKVDSREVPFEEGIKIGSMVGGYYEVSVKENPKKCQQIIEELIAKRQLELPSLTECYEMYREKYPENNPLDKPK